MQTIELTKSELAYLLGVVKNDKTIPRSLFLKIRIAHESNYINDPKYGEMARKLIGVRKRELEKITKQEKPPEPVNENRVMWKTKDGREIPIDTMTDDHIVRSIRLLRRKAIEKILFLELNTTVDKILERTKINLLIDEAKKRNLSYE